jgi:hypothetical protein
MKLLYCSIQFCWHFLSFTFKHISCTVYFKHTQSPLLPQCEIQYLTLIQTLLIQKKG